MNKEEFLKKLKEELNIELSEEKINKLDTYYELLIEWNSKFNLTTITEKESVYLKHFYDSLCIAKTTDFSKKLLLCDIGTGAGFPGMVLAIVFDEPNFTLVESNSKKCMFLNEVKCKLNLNNVKIVNQRAEEFAKKNRETFDIVTLRAVSSLRIIEELSIPILKVGGMLLPLKSHIEDEVIEAKNTLIELNSHIDKIVEYTLPDSSYRTIPIIIKDQKTNAKYPRNYSQIVKKPL